MTEAFQKQIEQEARQAVTELLAEAKLKKGDVFVVGRFQAGILADVPAHDLAGRAAHHEHVALFQLCLFQQLFHCLPGFRLDLLFECVCHINYLVSIGYRDDPMFCVRLGPSVYNNFSGLPGAPLAWEA